MWMWNGKQIEKEKKENHWAQGRGIGNRELEMENGEWRMANGEWRMENGEWDMQN